MKASRGDVVLINHPFSDASGSKVRPALIVQNDRRNALLSETIVALITKNVRHVATDPTQLLIDLGTPIGKASGLNVNSAVKCGKLFYGRRESCDSTNRLAPHGTSQTSQ